MIGRVPMRILIKKFLFFIKLNKSFLSDFNSIPPIIPLVGARFSSDLTESTLNEIIKESVKTISIETRKNGDINAAFYSKETYIGQIPRDHLLYGSVPLGLRFKARLQLRGKTIYMAPETPSWLNEIQS